MISSKAALNSTRVSSVSMSYCTRMCDGFDIILHHLDVLELMEHTESWRSYLQDICTSKERSSRSVAIQCVEKFSGAVEPLCKEFGQVNSIDWMILQQDNFILTVS